MKEPFEAVRDRLFREWAAQQPEGETPAAMGAALVSLIVRSELLRHGIDASHPAAGKVFLATLEKLRQPDALGPAHSHAEAVFRRLADNPEAAVAYLEQHITEKSAAQSKRAKAPRPSRLDSISQRISDIVEVEPDISAKEVERDLLRMEGINIVDGEIINAQDGSRMSQSNLASRVSDAKKRIRAGENFGRASIAR